MSYEVTATRRRPQKFEDLVGQEFVVATLKNAIQSGKIAHAYLFSGPRGCGKTSSARILAKTLNCEHGPTATPCEKCANCQAITKGSSLDVIEIDGASNTSVNDIRQIKDEVLFPPQSSRYKIYIIDEVHMLSTSAFNALLKTIEEPPEYVIFIFATTELHKVPATIKSRCQQFHFRLGSVEQIKDVLAKAASEIGIQADEEALYWIARESTGSFRDAYTLFDQVVAFSDNHITYEKIRDKLGLVGVEALNEISEFCVAGNSKAALEKLDELLTNGVSIEQFISNYADYIRSLLLIESGIQKESLLGQNVERYSKTVLSSWNRIMLERALNVFLNLFRDVRYSLSPRYEVELAISRLCWLSQYVSVNEVKKAIEDAKTLLLNAGAIQTDGVPSSQSPVQLGQNAAAQSAVNKGGPNPFSDSGFQKNQNSGLNSAENEQSSEDYTEEEFVRNNPDLTLDELKQEIFHEFSLKNEELLANLINATKNWSYQNGIIRMETESKFFKFQMDKNASEINVLLTKIWGKSAKIFVDVAEKVCEIPVSKDLPVNVKMLSEAFRGEVVSVTADDEKSNQNKTSENGQTQNQNFQSANENTDETDDATDFDDSAADD